MRTGICGRKALRSISRYWSGVRLESLQNAIMLFRNEHEETINLLRNENN
jgi:hypothetical protein